MSAWKCPLTGDPTCRLPHAISQDGGLRHYQKMYAEELSKLGWKHVDWPSQSYYWDHDKNHPSYLQREKIGLGEGAEVLKVDII